jgi:two-component system response regulator HydG
MSLLFQSQSMLQLLEQARRLAKSRGTVLITGESGTGKELLARWVHQHSPRAEQPYIAVNCAALPETLVESELFGHEHGAFTGADGKRIGRFEAAHRGTLFLDEVGELPKATQPKLLRALEEGEYQRVGSNDVRNVESRIIAATNRTLGRDAKAGKFRTDLYHRLNVLSLEVPPLRERREDIPLLANHFREQFADEGEVPVRGFAAATIRALSRYDWPGNVRQLRNVVRRACVLATADLIEQVDLPEAEEEQPDIISLPAALQQMSLRDVERHVILSQLKRCAGNRSQAAATLGVTTRTLRNKMVEYRRLGFAG